MSVTLEGASPAYVPARVPADPDPNPQAQATRQQQIEAQIRAQIIAARKAQEELERAQKAQQENQDKAKARQLQADVEAKQKLAQQKWADLKATVKERIEADGPKGRAKATDLVKTMSDDGRYKSLVDEAAKEKPDVKTVATGNAEADAAARRVAGAYAKGGDVGAARALRAELEGAKTPADRAAIMKASMPVVDRVAGDVGMNARRGAGDWGKDGYEPGGSYTTDLDNNPNPIDSREEFDYAVADLNASVNLAGDSEAAFHIANGILQVMPGGNQGNSATNLLGLLGEDLNQPTAEKSPLLGNAIATRLIQPAANAPAGTELAAGQDERNHAAKFLEPDLIPQVVVQDWTDARGVRHDGSVWHEVSQNPDLFLTADQKAAIEKKTQGWAPSEVDKEKTAQGVQNLRDKYGTQDLDHVDDDQAFGYDNGDPTRKPTGPLDASVQAKVDDAKAGHGGDLQYANDLDALTNGTAFRAMGKEQQAEAVGQYDRTWTQAAKGGSPLDAHQKQQLGKLISSDGFHSVDPRVQDRLLGLFTEDAKNDPGRIDKLQALVDSDTFRSIDNEAEEFKVVDRYQHDTHYRDKVDALVSSKLPAADRKTALGVLTHIATERQRYTDADGGEQAKVMDNAYDMVTSDRFRHMNRAQQISAENYLIKKGDEEYGLGKDGAKKALDKAEKDKLQNLGDNPGFIAMGSESDQIHALEAYQHDEFYRNQVDALAGNNGLSADDKKNAFAQLDRVAHDDRYTVNITEDKKHLMDRAYAMVTSDRFRKLSPQQRDVATNELLEQRLDPHGDTHALDKAEKTHTADLDHAGQPGGPGARSPSKPPYTENSVKADLSTLEGDAHTVATSDATINDDLRRVAGQDAVSYAYLALKKAHASDKDYLALLDKTLPGQRIEYTRQQVQDLKKQGHDDQALKVLGASMDATADPAERAQLWKQVGEPEFGRAYFDKRVADIVGDKNALNHAGNLAKLFKEVGENAPPEAANLALDAVKAQLDKGGKDNVMAGDLLADAGLDGEAYGALCELVEKADSLGAGRAKEFAGLYVKAIKDAAADPQRMMLAQQVTDGMSAGMFRQADKAIADHGAAKLSIAMYNEFKATTGLPDGWAQGAMHSMRNSIQQGIGHFHDNVKTSVTDWQDKNKNALHLVQEYGSLDPKQVAQAIINDRQSHPDAYYRADGVDGKPDGIDVLQQQMEDRGVQLDGLMRDLTGLDIGFDHPTVPAEKQLADSIKGLDGDELAMSTLHGNATLQQTLATRLNFGHFDTATGTLDPAAVVDNQRHYLDRLVADYHLPDTVAGDLENRTKAWEKDLRTELAKGDKASDAKLQKLTDDYQKDLDKLLKDHVPQGTSALSSPSPETVTKIKNLRQSIGTITSTLRLTASWYKQSGEAVLTTYMQLAGRRGLKNPNDIGAKSELVGNAAKYLFASEAQVEGMQDYIAGFKQKIADETAKHKGPLSAADQKALLDEYKNGLPDYAKAPDPKNGKLQITDPAHGASRFMRGLAAACFFSSAFNNAGNARGEKGVTSSDAFAVLFAAGGVVDSSRAIGGFDFQGKGFTADFVNKTRLGGLLEAKRPGVTEDFVKFVKGNGLGAVISAADLEWAYEDFNGEPIWEDKKTGEGDPRAGWLTSGIVAGDAIELGASFLKTEAGGALLDFIGGAGTAAAAESWLPVVGWVGAGITVAFLGARFAYGVTSAKNAFEYDDNPRYAEMVKSLGFTDQQAKELMNENGGASNVKVKDWEWFIPGWNVWESVHSTYGYAASFFTEGGMGAMHVLNPLLDQAQVPQQQRLQYLQSLTPDQMHQLVAKTHEILDNDMKDNGGITRKSTTDLEQWMKDNGLWKAEYLG